MSGWFLANLVWASAAMLLVLAVRRPVARWFGAGSAYALWLLPLLRLLLPPLPLPRLSVPLPPLEIIVSVEETAASLPPAGGPGQWVPLLLAIWAGGAAVFLVRQWLAYRDLLVGLSATSRGLGSRDGLPLVESTQVQGPVALGLLDRRIVVPADFEQRYSPAERALALAHETIHHRRGDIWWNLAALLVLALNWFNPIAWRAFRAFREDQELACDAAVAAAAPPEARHDYACALVKSASRPGLIAACPLNRADQLKRRLRMMNDHRNSRVRLLGGAAAITILGGLTALIGAPGFAHPHPDGEPEVRRERVMIMTHKGEGGDAAEHRIRMRGGEHGEHVMAHCPEGQSTEVSEGEGSERTRIVLCSRGAATPAERVEHLQRARDRLARDDELSAEHRARITAALDREIARLRGQ